MHLSIVAWQNLKQHRPTYFFQKKGNIIKSGVRDNSSITISAIYSDLEREYHIF